MKTTNRVLIESIISALDIIKNSEAANEDGGPINEVLKEIDSLLIGMGLHLELLKDTDANKVRIRKGGLCEELYLTRKGTWESRLGAAVFANQAVAERFAKKHNITDYGLF